MTRLFLLGVDRPRVIALVLFTLTVLLGSGLGRLRLDTSFDSLIPAHDPSRQIYQQVTREFGSDNKTIIYVAEPELWTAARLRQLDMLQRDLGQLQFVERIDSLFSLRTVQDDAGRIGERSISDRIPRTDAEARILREQILSNPLYVGNFLSRTGEATAIIVSVVNPDQAVAEDEFNQTVFSNIETLLARYENQFQRVFQVGSPRIDAEIRGSLSRDFVRLGPLAALALLSAVFLFLRSALAAALPLATSFITLIWTFGLLGWLNVPLNVLSAMIPALVIVIGSTEDTHIMAAFAKAAAGDARAPARAIIGKAARQLGVPVALTVLTTTLGFATNLASDIGLIRDFAVAATIAMLSNGVVTVLLAPMLLARFGQATTTRSASAGLARFPAWLVQRFAVLQDRHPAATILLTVALCGVLALQAARLHITNDPFSYFPADGKLLTDTQIVHEDLAGVRVFFVNLQARPDAFREPANIARLAQIQAFIANQHAFDLSLSLADQLAFINRVFRGDKPDAALLPDSRELISQYLLFFHRSELEPYVSHDFSQANIVVRHNISDSRQLSAYIQALENAVSRIAGPDMRTALVGESLMLNRAADSLMAGQLQALALILGLIFVIMSVMFTDLRGGALALIPASIPIIVMFGVMGLLDIALNPATAMLGVIAIGIAVDGTVHLLSRYNDLCRRTSDDQAAVRQAVTEQATPLVVSGLALSLGFGVLMLSEFAIIAQFGALAAAIMLVSIFANLLITPIIMVRWRLVGLHQIVGMQVDPRVFEHSPLLLGMSGYQRRKAILISELHEFDAGDVLIQQGEFKRSMYMLLEGEVEVIQTENGVESHLARLGPGEIFGEVGYLHAARRTAMVRALEHVAVLRFDHDKMQSDLRHFPRIAAKLHDNISMVLKDRTGSNIPHQAASA